MYDKILIANRGEIACRVQRSARALGIATVAVYSDADADALHVRMADEAVRIGPAAASESYLRGAALIAAATNTGAQAIHPGYGFLSENAQFAADCATAGVTFVGPPPAAIRAMASKSAAKVLMQQAGVPLVPGFHGEEQSEARLQREADRIGYPVLIKASAGGGGKGMRRVDKQADFAAALASCQREATASFADGRVLVEKYLLRPRHIEIQIFTDTHGNGVYLFERDCSVQRRHQKVLEEAPAPGMEPQRRAQMGAAALAAARAVGYVGAGTVEFIVEPGGRFYFMEMNTRLQVEHPVTEMITGLDLVEWQLRVASGEALPLRQEQLAIRGHAIEARIYAEDPARGFLPATGRLEHYRTPAATATVRIDSGVEQGDAITPWYDPMIAKLIVWGETRELARVRLLQALEQFQIVGLTNNVQFLSRLVATPAFAGADLDTALIEREHALLFAESDPAPDEALIAAALQIAAMQRQSARGGPGAQVWRSADGWRLNAPAARNIHFRSQGTDRLVVLRPTSGGYELEIGGTASAVQCVPLSDTDARLLLNGRSFDATTLVRDGHCDVFVHGRHHRFEHVDPLAHVGEQAVAEGSIRAIMPGRIAALLVKPGARVKRGDPLLILEAMKMEHTLGAPADGVCEAFNVTVGAQVTEGSELVQFAPDPPPEAADAATGQA